LVKPPNDLASILEMVECYRLLPSDAVIVAACRHNKIHRIATLDSDFKRVDFLKVIGA
jgi:hypothetical protein